MNVQRTLKQGLDLFLTDVLPLVVAALLCLLLVPLTIGVLGGPMIAGLFKMVLARARDGRAPRVGDVFAFERFGAYLAAFYGLGILVAVGLCLLVVPGLYLAAIWLYVFPLLVERNLRLGEAMAESKRIVEQSGVGPHFGLALILALLAGLLHVASGGVLLWVLGTLVALPFSVACAVAAWRAVQRPTELPPPAAVAAGQ